MRCTVYLCALLGALTACGGTTTNQALVTGPFTDEHAAVFDNSVDYIGNPGILEDNWLDQWETELRERVRLADAVALVRITTLREDFDLDRHQTYRLVGRVEDRAYGAIPDEVTLVVRQTDAGFGTVDGNTNRILEVQFLAFVKWVDEDGRIGARWHLSPAADTVIGRVNSLVDRYHTPEEDRRTVIVRQSGSGDLGEDEEE